MLSNHSTVPGVAHHHIEVNGATLHYVTAGPDGGAAASASPVLLVHGFPESWWAFHKLIPLLAAKHRVVAVDLRGFGQSSVADDDHDSAIAAEDLHGLIAALGLGPVHLLGQDIAGAAVVRLAAAHPEDVRSLIAVEMGLAGFGLEGLADVTHGGSWHIGVLAAPQIARMLLPGREAALLGEWAFPAMSAVAGAITADDVDEFARGFARPDGWNGAIGLYRSMLTEGPELAERLTFHPLTLPALAVGAGGGAFTAATLRQIMSSDIVEVELDGVGHYAALEAPQALADAILGFLAGLEPAA